MEKILTLERLARQYQVLKDPQMLGNLAEKHKELVHTLEVLNHLLHKSEEKKALQAILEGVNHLLEVLQSKPKNKQPWKLLWVGLPV